jgi:hypothetical protein
MLVLLCRFVPRSKMSFAGHKTRRRLGQQTPDAYPCGGCAVRTEIDPRTRERWDESRQGMPHENRKCDWACGRESAGIS